jgi:MYXO-CTERM domain-containing protein
MKNRRQLALGLAALLGLGVRAARLRGVAGPLLALLVQALLMRWALTALRLTRPALRGGWTRVRPWETGLYRRLGVLPYRDLLRAVGWERYRRVAQGFDGRRSSLPAYERMTREAEASHLLLGALSLGLLWATRRRASVAACFGLSTVLLHLYPVWLQRTLRARLQRLGIWPGPP